jgi:hypothetical protein
LQHETRGATVVYHPIEWDENNLEHAASRATVDEITQAIINAKTMTRHRTIPDRVVMLAETDGGRLLRVIADVVRGDTLRPVTAWEEKR